VDKVQRRIEDILLVLGIHNQQYCSLHVEGVDKVASSAVDSKVMVVVLEPCHKEDIQPEEVGGDMTSLESEFDWSLWAYDLTLAVEDSWRRCTKGFPGDTIDIPYLVVSTEKIASVVAASVVAVAVESILEDVQVVPKQEVRERQKRR
jgi:hypothetical protein